MYWEEQHMLLLADVHIGKAAHFRKAGIAVPGGVVQTDLDQWRTLIDSYSPKRIMILGDLFHSTANSEWAMFREFLESFPDIQFELIPGNHDKASKVSLENLPLKLREEQYRVDPFILSHHPLEKPVSSTYNIAGHIHPSVRLSGPARQRLRLPCFFFGSQTGILPAFGIFTGTFDVKPTEADHVFVIAEGQVICIKQD